MLLPILNKFDIWSYCVIIERKIFNNEVVRFPKSDAYKAFEILSEGLRICSVLAISSFGPEIIKKLAFVFVNFLQELMSR